MKKEKEIKSLNSEVQLVQMEKFTNDFDNAIKKKLKKDLKKLAIVLIPCSLLIFGYFIMNNTILLIAGIGIMSFAGIYKITSDAIKDIKKLNSQPNNTVLLDSDSEEELRLKMVLDKGIGKSEDKDFYNENVKILSERTETEDERKYRNALEKQKYHSKENNTNLHVVGDFLNKEETISQIFLEIYAYCKVYNIPDVEVTDNEWNEFFNILYSAFLEKDLEAKYYEGLSQLVRFVFAKALVNKTNNITLNDFIENLYYLQNIIFEKKEIVILQKKLEAVLDLEKTINFTDFVNKRRKK